MAQAARKVWRDLWHRFPAFGLGGGIRAKVCLPPDPDGACVETFLLSTMVVGLAEIGDKTQILSLMLAARVFCGHSRSFLGSFSLRSPTMLLLGWLGHIWVAC